jgi:hypothetical protein
MSGFDANRGRSTPNCPVNAGTAIAEIGLFLARQQASENARDFS